MTDINTIVTGITTAVDITKRLAAISKSIKNAEFNNLLADLSNQLADTKLEVVSLKNKVYELKEENLHLKTKNKKIIESQKIQTPAHNHNLSEYAIAILKKCKEKDIIEFTDISLAREISLSNIEFETGLGELRNKRLIMQAFVKMSFGGGDGGVKYRILQPGKEYMLQI